VSLPGMSVAKAVESPPAGVDRWGELDERSAHGWDWPVVVWIVSLHAGALAAPWCFSWSGLFTMVVLSWVTGSLGVCLGYHRLLTHGSFKTYPLVRRALAMLGLLAGEGPPLHWVAVHRKHHQFSDRPGDPHSPRDGAWWSHVFWLLPRPREPQWQAMIHRYAKDLEQDPFMPMLSKTFLLWHLLLAVVLMAAGTLAADWRLGLSLVVYGMFLRLVWVLHVTWLVNSASHMWGYRSYPTKDDSRNLWWVGLLAFGEGWHNNHHAYPGRARHGHRWWEIDMTYIVIWGLEKVGLAWNVVRRRS
jgi:sn-2 palmitoyl-lipid 9-desaturase